MASTRDQDVLLEALHELKSEMKAQSMTLQQVLEQARKTNGRVNMLEEWKHNVELREAHDEGIMEGAGTAAITKGQLRMLMGSASAIATLAGAVAGFIVRLS